MSQKSKKGKRHEARIAFKGDTKKYICIVCPNCCELETDGAEVAGARCEKGEAFARQEMILPLRVITTTVRCQTGEGMKMLPVKSASAVPLARAAEIVKGIKNLRLSQVPPIGSKLSLEDLPEPVELIVTGE